MLCSTFHGKPEGIRDLITYEASDARNLKKSFHEAVEDYLATGARKMTGAAENSKNSTPL